MATPKTAAKPEADAPASAPTSTILLVDDNDVTRVTTKWFLSNFGYVVVTAPNAEAGLALFEPQVHDLVITDNSMPGMTGTEMAHAIKLRCAATPVIMYTGQAPDDQSCIDLLILRPVHILALKDAVDRLLSPSGAPAVEPRPLGFCGRT